MKRVLTSVVGGIVCVLMAAPICAQGGGGGGGGGGAGGAGGAGSGGQGGAGQGGAGQRSAGQSGATGSTQSGATQGTAGAGTMSQTPWFSNQGIRSQLGLNDQQYNALNKAYGEAYSNYSSNVGQLSNLTPDQRTQRLQDLNSSFNQRLGQASQQIITDPAQQQRYNQLYLQYQGYGAFGDPQVQQKLNLNDQQKQQLQQLSNQYNQQFSTFSQGNQTDPQAANRQFTELRQQYNQKLNNILTPQQQQSWRQMTGDPYNFQYSDYISSQNQSGQRGQSGQQGTQQKRR